MDIKQLVTGDPKTGFYPITQDTITVIELNKAVMSLTNESSSEEIIAAFDNLESFQALITEVRNPQNICSGILINETPEDKRVGKYEASIIANTDAETLHVRWIENDKIVALTITNTDGTMSCVRNENNIGGGSGESDIYVFSPQGESITLEEYNALESAIDNNKMIIFNSSGVNIIPVVVSKEESSIFIMGLGAPFTYSTITIDKNTLTIKSSGTVISDIVLTKDNYKEFTPTQNYEPATKKYVDDNISLNNKNVFVVNDGYNLLDIDSYSEWTETISIPKKLSSNNTLFIINMNSINTNDYFNSSIIVSMRTEPVNSTVVCRNNISDAVGNKYNINILIKYKNSPSDNDYYSATFTCEQFKYIQRVLTESEYAALGEAVNTDNVLYFVTPDA